MAGVAALSTKLEALQKDVARKMGADRGVFGALDGKVRLQQCVFSLLGVQEERTGGAAGLVLLGQRMPGFGGWMWCRGCVPAT